MGELQKEIGSRLRKIRENIFFLGIKLSARQFAEKLGSSKDKISNYETGRPSVPDKLLVDLYKNGINPTYVLTGEGEVYDENSAGQSLKEKIEGKESEAGKVELVSELNLKEMSDEELVEFLSVAAGDIKKRLKSK